MTPGRPNLKGDSGAGGGRERQGEGQAMTDVFDEIHEDELTEAELDELEALGAAEDAELILAAFEVGQIDA